VEVLTHNIVPFLGILIILVVIHEFGHFITAKLFGVKVLEFAVGYPPRAFAFKYGETEYAVNILPLGGYVRLLGEEDPSDPRSLAAQKAWKRLVIMGAGAFMNFVLAITIFAIGFMLPREVNVGQAVISQVVPDSPAANAGLKAGDIIQSIDGRTIESVQDVSYNIRLNLGEDTPITVKRTDPITQETQDVTVHVKPRWAPGYYVYQVQEGQTPADVARDTGYTVATVRQAAGIDTTLTEGQTLSIDTSTGPEQYVVQAGDTVETVSRELRVPEAAVSAAAGLPDPDKLSAGPIQFQQGPTGISIGAQYPFTEDRSYGFFDSIRRGWRATFDSLKLARNEIYSWTKGGAAAPVSGPIGIAQATGEVVNEAGWRSLLDMAALLSINLAILNILPLPMLDGGRMAFVVIEILRRGRRIAPDKEALVHLVGMAAIGILVVVMSYFDIARIVNGESLFR
jgi:regulator of sigma E protease